MHWKILFFKLRVHTEQFFSSESGKRRRPGKHFTYPAAQVDREDGLFPLLQKEDDHEGEGVWGDATFSLAVDVTQLRRKKKTLNFNTSQILTHYSLNIKFIT